MLDSQGPLNDLATYRRQTVGMPFVQEWPGVSQCNKQALRKLFAETRLDRESKVVGLDVAGEALDYAKEVGVIDAGLATNLELLPPSVQDEELLAEIDVVISIGAIGYVGVPTFSRILDCAECSPWFALFDLRRLRFAIRTAEAHSAICPGAARGQGIGRAGRGRPLRRSRSSGL